MNELLDWNDFFDPYNVDHMEAYGHLKEHGSWPEGFLPENVEIDPLWIMKTHGLMAEAWYKYITSEKHKRRMR
jgi:hypothetical protein